MTLSKYCGIIPQLIISGGGDAGRSAGARTAWRPRGPGQILGGIKIWRGREREPITGVCPQRGPEAEPLVRGSGGEAHQRDGQAVRLSS